MPELHRPASAFAARGGRFWVAEGEGDPEPRVIGCVGLRPAADGAGVELCKLYVARGARRRGLGSALCGLVEAEAQARGAASVELWTDTRFADAHRLYERRGYQRGPATRELHDLSHTVEYSYRLDLSGAKRGSLQGAP
ncbi:MAG: GNAT family N-acetyltransferase [Polyangiaceae bacterium]|nr:GNAT family N-acetyltransferase [Polyangiaceae bacterium]